MILDFDAPKKIMKEEERREKYSSDCSVPGTYVPNMSKADNYKWKGKHIKGIDERIEIRKCVMGVQLLCIVYKDEERYEKETNEYYSREKLIHNKIHLSANGKMCLTSKDWSELNEAIKEAVDILNK